MLVMRIQAILLLLAVLAVGALPAAADEPFEDDQKYAPMPWHLVDIWWDIGHEMPFESLAVDVNISTDVPSSVNLYIAPIGLAHLSKIPFYGGIQTRADGHTKKDRALRGIGPGFLFSMWGERSLDAIRPSEGGLLQSSGHEGDFVSVRRPYKWEQGKYTYRLTRMDREEIDGKPHTWVGAFVYSHQQDENVFVGALRFKGEKLRLDQKVANFLEVYGERKPVADIPKLTVTFSPPVVNGQAVNGPSAEATYPQGVPDYANAVASHGSVAIRVGEHVRDRRQRSILLIETKRDR